MKSALATHRQHPWRVHKLCPDFSLLDVWQIPIDADPARGEDFESFYRLFLDNGIATDSVIANTLFRLRLRLGRALGLDRSNVALPIPGCRETSVAARLTEEDRVSDRSQRVTMPYQPVEVMPIYLFDEEALLEISNRTIAALLHLGWVDAELGHKTVELAVYIKSRGWSSQAYLALIKPFRHAFIYPAWIGRICRRWQEERAG
jgi:hypothetical protein